MTQSKNTYKKFPDEKGYFGQFGGRYVSENTHATYLRSGRRIQ